MRAAPALLLLAALAACSNRDYVGESWSQYYPPPVDEKRSRAIERMEIWAWKKDFRQRRHIGYLEKTELTIAGSRQPRDLFYLLDVRGVTILGFATESGEFFRYRKDGSREKIGDFPVQDLGLKLFYGLSVEHEIRLEPIDPYRS